MPTRSAFFISDRTGITAQSVGQSLLSQFPDIDFQVHWLPFVDTPAKVEEALKQIQQMHQQEKVPPIVISTVVEDNLRQALSQCEGVFIDIFQTFIGPLEGALGMKSQHAVGVAHGIQNNDAYFKRIEAVNFALQNDDGMNIKAFGQAEIILLGVSRSGKTPTCLYLALQQGILAANYPLLWDDLQTGQLPELLKPYKDKLFALTIDPRRLQHIRQTRRPNSQYAAYNQCVKEVQMAEQMYTLEKIPYLNTTNTSIEEIASRIRLLLIPETPMVSGEDL